MRGRDQLARELDALLKERGAKVEDQNCQVLAAVIRWTRETGHGDIKLSAVSGRLSLKFRIDSVITVGSSVTDSTKG